MREVRKGRQWGGSSLIRRSTVDPCMNKLY